MTNSFNLDRFVQAQRPVYPRVLDELRHGYKVSCWMWYIFPQLRILGRSPTALYYGLRSRAEADAYIVHPLLASRLIECTQLVNAVPNNHIEHILGATDARKFRSCITLFAGDHPCFQDALDIYFGGLRDWITTDFIENEDSFPKPIDNDPRPWYPSTIEPKEIPHVKAGKGRNPRMRRLRQGSPGPQVHSQGTQTGQARFDYPGLR